MQHIEAFSRAASTYETHARIQSWAADVLVHMLLKVPEFQARSVLELGCGTGLLTRALLQTLPFGCRYVATDLSPAMLAEHRRRTDPCWPGLEWALRDAEALEDREAFDLVASSYMLQWTQDPAACLQRQMAALRPGGVLALACPVSGSFPEWQAAAAEAGLVWTANALPEVGALQLPGSVSFELRSMTETYENAAAFFRSIKGMGAQTCRQLGGYELRRLLKTWDGKSPGAASVTWHTAFAICCI
ncbi:MAG: methyltransferase domain-containing protein [Chlamydiia bacterium]|nr:methyltransferase domain-containing protein [Chlamydiia bacterium]